MKTNSQRSLVRSGLAGFGVLLLAAAWTASAGGQSRQMPTPKPPAGPQTVQPIPGGPPNPYLVEIGALKQQVASLQQGLKEVQKENGLLKTHLGTLDAQLKKHAHRLYLAAYNRGQGALSNYNFVMVPITASKWTKETGEPIF